MFWRLIIVQGDQGNVSAILSFMESSYFSALISYIYQNVSLERAHEPSKSSVSVLRLTVSCIYTRLQMKYDFSKVNDSGNSIEICPLSFQ